MITAHIYGRIRFKRRYEDLADKIIAHFFPDGWHETVNIEIDIVQSCEGNAAGYCLGDTDFAEIELARNCMGVAYSLDEVAKHLAHELVHAKQWIKGELGETGQIWHGVSYRGCETAYIDRPWEEEAYRLETDLIERLWEKIDD